MCIKCYFRFCATRVSCIVPVCHSLCAYFPFGSTNTYLLCSHCEWLITQASNIYHTRSISSSTVGYISTKKHYVQQIAHLCFFVWVCVCFLFFSHTQWALLHAGKFAFHFLLLHFRIRLGISSVISCVNCSRQEPFFAHTKCLSTTGYNNDFRYTQKKKK